MKSTMNNFFAMGLIALSALAIGSIGCAAPVEMDEETGAFAEQAIARQAATDRTKGMGIHEYTLTSEDGAFVFDLFGENGESAGWLKATKVNDELSVELERGDEVYRFTHSGQQTQVEYKGEKLVIAFDDQNEIEVPTERAIDYDGIRPTMELAVSLLADAGLEEQLAIAAPSAPSAGCWTRTASSFGKSAPCSSISTQASLDCIFGFSYKSSCSCSCNFVNWCTCSLSYCCK